MTEQQNSKIIISKTALVPLSLAAAFVAMAITATMFISGMQADIDQNRTTFKSHISDATVHQPFQDKLQTWYTRDEGETAEEQISLLEKRLTSIERKLDILIASQNIGDP